MRLFIVAALVAVACADHHTSGDMHGKMDSGDMMMDEHMKMMMELKEKMMEMAMSKMAKSDIDMSEMTMSKKVHMMMKAKIHMMMEKMNITFDAEETLDRIDADKDGVLSEQEYVDAQMYMDQDKDNMVNSTEFLAASIYGGWPMRAGLYIFFRLDNNSDTNLVEDEFRAAFNGMDMNNDKSVNLMELQMATGMMIMAMAKHHMRASGITMVFTSAAGDDGELTADEFVKDAMMSDTDGDGSLSEMEFVKGWAGATNSTIVESQILFEMLDLHTGTLDNMLSADDFKTLVGNMDYDKSGMVSMEEYLNVMTYYAANVDEKMLMEIAEGFMRTDTDMDGVISFDEARAFFKSWDKDMDEKLNYTEFVPEAMAGGASEAEALYAFFVMDNNTDAHIDHDEFRMSYMHGDMDMDKKVNFMEYAMHKHEMAMQLDKAMKLRPTFEQLFYLVDTDKYGFLTEDQLLTAFRVAGSQTKDQFVATWMNITHMNKHMAELYFEMVDYSTMDDIYSEEDEKKYFENSDYNRDGKMSMKEYLDGLLYHWAKVNSIVAMEMKAKMHKMMKGMAKTVMVHMMMKKKIHMMMDKMNITINGTAAFTIMDTDDDMMLSESEFLSAQMSMDTDNDDKINSTEYVNAAKYGGWTPRAALYIFHTTDNNSDIMLDKDELRAAFMAMDMNHDSSVCMMEFAQTIAMTIMRMAHNHKMGPALVKLFNGTDTDMDMLLSAEELKAGVMSFDENKDGKLVKEEFVKGFVMATNSSIKASEIFFDMLDYSGTADGMLGDDDLKVTFNGMDYGNDGQVDMEEFLNTMVFFAAKIDNQMLMRVEKSFKRMDTNMDGSICHQEFHDALKPWDKNMDNMLNYTEFVGGVMEGGDSQTEALYTFFMINNNTDEQLDKDELMNMFKHVDMDMDMKMSFMEAAMHNHKMATQLDKAMKMTPMLKALFTPADTNGDGSLSEAELLAAYKADGGDGSSTKEKFVAGWMSASHMDQKSSEMFFHMVDYSTMDDVYDEADQKKWFENGDYNKDGQMTMEEYLNFMLYYWAQINKHLGREMMEKMHHHMMMMAAVGKFDPKAAFAMVDTNSDELISEQEFGDLYASMSSNKDKVSDKEFVAIMMKTGMPEMGSLYIFFRTDENEDNIFDAVERENTFKSLDANGDKMVSMEEYKNVMKKLVSEYAMLKSKGHALSKMFTKLDDNLDNELTQEEMKSMVKHMDKDMDGYVSEDEFVAGWPAEAKMSEDDLRRLFGFIDGDDDGFFGNDLEVGGLFKGFDYDNDNMVTEKEFLESMLYFAARIQAEKDAEAAMGNAMKDAIIGFF